jgi:hypothetical protein
MTENCIFIKTNGERCGGYPVEGSDYCINHEPRLQEKKLEAVKNGGAASSYEKLELALPELVINTPNDVVTAAVQTVNEVRTGQLPPKVASTIGYLLGVVLKAYEVANLDQRVEMIESVLIERRMAIRRK